MPLYHDSGAVMSDAEAQKRIRQTIERAGKLILSAIYQPQIGEIQTWAGLPLKVVRHVSREEGRRESRHTREIWGDFSKAEEDFYFEVVVAD